MIHEGKALQLYLKLEHGMISKVAKKMGYTTNVYMYDLFKIEILQPVIWINLEKKAKIKKTDVLNNFDKLTSGNNSDKEKIELLERMIATLERENLLLHKLLNKDKKVKEYDLHPKIRPLYWIIVYICKAIKKVLTPKK